VRVAVVDGIHLLLLFGQGPAPLVDPLLAGLSDGAREVRVRAVRGLAALPRELTRGPRVLGALRRATGDRRPSVREAATRLLRRLGVTRPAGGPFCLSPPGAETGPAAHRPAPPPPRPQ